MLEYVDLDTARASKTTRIVTSALVASPWSEAAKGLFVVAKLPAVVVARGRERTADFIAWTGVDNVPTVLHADEPVRTSWASIAALVARLAPDTVVPADPRARARVFGLLDAIAGDSGLGWTGRLAMIHASFASEGKRGFAPPIAAFLAKRYGYSRSLEPAQLRDRVAELFALLRSELTGPYFGGDRPSAVDIYVATFLTPLAPIDEAACPQMAAPLRDIFGTAAELLGDLVPAELAAVRARMFEHHLPSPIRLA